MHHAQEHLDHGRFAGPVSSQEAVDPPLGDAQIERIDHAAAVVVLRQAVGNDHVGHGRGRHPLVRSASSLDSWRICHWNCLARAVTKASHFVGAEAQVDRFGEEMVHQLVEPFLADLPGQFRLGPGHEDPQPGPRVEDPFPFQFRIDAGHGVGVDHQQPREVADRGQAVLGLEPSPRDGLAKLLGQLPVDRQPAGGIDLELHGHLANCTSDCSTVAKCVKRGTPRFFRRPRLWSGS